MKNLRVFTAFSAYYPPVNGYEILNYTKGEMITNENILRTTGRSSIVIACVLVLFFSASSIFVFGCSGKNEVEVSGKEIATEPVFPDAAFSVLGNDIVEVAGESTILSEIRETGLMVVSLQCDRPLMCARNEYGIPRGFEVDLLRQFAYFLGAKLNVVDPDKEAMVRGPAACSADTASFFSDPYFYSSATGWICLEVENDPVFKNVINLVLNHIYDTGAYQQLFVNWFRQADYLEKFEGDPDRVETQGN